MTVQETVSFAGQFFASIWSFMRGVEVPFMQGVSVAGLMVGLFVARLGLKLVLRLLGQNPDFTNTGNNLAQRGRAAKDHEHKIGF